MEKGSGGTRASNGDNSRIAQLMNSPLWGIREGMQRLEDDIARGADFSDMKGLTQDEKRVVNAYLTHAYKDVNAALRGESPHPDALLLADKIDSALAKLPTYQGDTTRVVGFYGRKGAANAAAFAATFPKGSVVKFNEFLSTGTNSSKIKSKFKGDTAVTFPIKSKTGRDLRRYNSEKREVLFRKGTSFKVSSRRGNHITLEEV